MPYRGVVQWFHTRPTRESKKKTSFIRKKDTKLFHVKICTQHIPQDGQDHREQSISPPMTKGDNSEGNQRYGPSFELGSKYGSYNAFIKII